MACPGAERGRSIGRRAAALLAVAAVGGAALLSGGCRAIGARDTVTVAAMGADEHAGGPAVAMSDLGGGCFVRLRCPRYVWDAGTWVYTQGWQWCWVPGPRPVATGPGAP
jgi:hypothetical protein